MITSVPTTTTTTTSNQIIDVLQQPTNPTATQITTKTDCHQSDHEVPSLWERMGGIEAIDPLVTAVLHRHLTDPLTKEYF
eukprot:Pgem_evm1s15237